MPDYPQTRIFAVVDGNSKRFKHRSDIDFTFFQGDGLRCEMLSG